MPNKKVVIVHPTDPFGQKVGGIDTFIKGFIKYAPEEFDIQYIGITSSPIERPVGQWSHLSFGERKFLFYPILKKNKENSKSLVPLSLKFTLKLKNLADKFLSYSEDGIVMFHRPEPCLAFPRNSLKRVMFVHNDVNKIISKDSESLWKYFPGLYKAFENKVVVTLDYIYTVNNETLVLYRKLYPSMVDRMNFIPTWVDNTIFHPSLDDKENIRLKLGNYNEIPISSKWLLFVGRLQQQKAPLRLIDTFFEYRKIREDAVLLIIGDGNLKAQVLRRVKEKGISSSVYFLGTKTQQELALFYQAADVMVLTSNFEGMPMSCLEALGSGLPVVSTNVGEVCRVIQNGVSGEVVNGFSPREIAAAINKIIINLDRYSSKNCVASVFEYNPKEVLKPVYKMCNNLLGFSV